LISPKGDVPEIVVDDAMKIEELSVKEQDLQPRTNPPPPI
jgi:hypothetical protein